MTSFERKQQIGKWRQGKSYKGSENRSLAKTEIEDQLQDAAKYRKAKRNRNKVESLTYRVAQYKKAIAECKTNGAWKSMLRSYLNKAEKELKALINE